MPKGGAELSKARVRLRRALAYGIALMAATSSPASPLRIRNALSPENAKRPLRSETRYIVLHTTEGREAGSLRKLRRRGEAHYFVHRDGRVARIVDRGRVATHAGLSMWAGREDLDTFSLAIEVAGYHDKEPTRAQLAAVRELLRQLQSLYGIPDDRVLTHSMVAYGGPNRFHPRPHRGRKRCGMIFANREVRRKLGLTEAPATDPDVAAGRLRVGDRSLQRRLFPEATPTLRASVETHPPTRQTRTETHPPEGRAREAQVSLPGGTVSRERTAWKIAGPAYAHPSTVYVFPDGTRTRGDAIRRWGDIPPGTRVLLGDAAAEPRPAERLEVPSAPRSEKGEPLAAGTISRTTTAWKIAGPAYDSASTVYVFPDGTRTRGDEVRRWGDIPPGTRIFVGDAAAELQPARAAAAASPPPPEGGLLLVSRPVAAHELLGDVATADTTTYLFPSGTVRTGAELDAEPRGRRRLETLPAGTRVLVGYLGAGRVSKGLTPRRVAGNLWNEPSTYYRIPGGAIRAGTELDPGRVPLGTLVFLPDE